MSSPIRAALNRSHYARPAPPCLIVPSCGRLLAAARSIPLDRNCWFVHGIIWSSGLYCCFSSDELQYATRVGNMIQKSCISELCLPSSDQLSHCLSEDKSHRCPARSVMAARPPAQPLLCIVGQSSHVFAKQVWLSDDTLACLSLPFLHVLSPSLSDDACLF